MEGVAHAQKRGWSQVLPAQLSSRIFPDVKNYIEPDAGGHTRATAGLNNIDSDDDGEFNPFAQSAAPKSNPGVIMNW